MGVPEDNQLGRTWPSGIDILTAMGHAIGHALLLAGDGRRQPCQLAAVTVAAHRQDRRDLAELGQNCPITDIARVENPVTAGGKLEHAGPQKPMGVGHNGDT